MVLTAFRGAVGFLSRLPVGTDDRAWAAFARTPAAFPLAGYLVGAVVALAVLPSLPPPTTALVFAIWLYLLTGITHLDGLADTGDAAAVHGSPDERLRVMRDPAVGTGGALFASLAVVGVALAGLALAPIPTAVAVGLVVAAEVGAKVGMAVLVCLGTAPHDGMGASFTTQVGPRSLVMVLLAAAPAAVLTWPDPAAGLALGAAVVAALAILAWANARLGGVTGDVLGAANEIARLVALHVGVVAWTRF